MPVNGPARRLVARRNVGGIEPAGGERLVEVPGEAVLLVAGLTPFFSATVSSEEVPRGKPAPDVYLEAARRLGEALVARGPQRAELGDELRACQLATPLAIAVVVVVRLINRRIPGLLIAVIIAIVVSQAAHLAHHPVMRKGLGPRRIVGIVRQILIGIGGVRMLRARSSSVTNFTLRSAERTMAGAPAAIIGPWPATQR